MNVAWGEVRRGRDAARAADAAPSRLDRRVDDRAGGTRPIGAVALPLRPATSGVRGPAPHRGEHNAEVLAEWLGMSPATVAELAAAGVLSHDRETLGG